MSELFKDVLEESEESNKNSNFNQNDFIFTSDFLPEKFPNRTKQLKELIKYFHRFFNILEIYKTPQFRQTVLVLGDVGSGKTSVVKRFGIEFENFAKENYPVLEVKYRHINCRRNRTVYSVLVHLLQSLIPYFPNRGFSPADLLRILESHLRDTNSYLLLTLDEIDVLARQDPEFISFMYSLTRLNDELLIPEEDVNQRISLILISRNANTFDLFDSATRSSLPKNIIYFPKYTTEQLIEILQERCSEFNPDVINSEALRKIAEISSASGDARYVIELLGKAIQQAEIEGASCLLPDHVEMIHSSVYSVARERIIDLEPSHKIFLLTVAKWLAENPTQEYITMNEIKKYLPVHAERIGLKVGKGNTSLWLYMKTLSSLGLIKTRVMSSGRLGRTTVINIELEPNIIVNELEKLLENFVEEQEKK